jgi:hypothetical protein
MDISNIQQSVEQLTNILNLSVEQSTDMAQKIMKVNVEQMVHEGKEELIGTIIDTYA